MSRYRTELVAALALVLWAQCAQAQYQQCPADTVLAGPTAGAPSAVGCRPLVGGDMPASYVTGIVNGGTFSVLQYGAVGNGIADDSTAIGAALAACGAAHGGVVTFPATGAAYVVKNSNKFVIPSGCSVYFPGGFSWPGPYDNVEADWTRVGSWLRCDDPVNPCITVAGVGSRIIGLNVWQTQPTPTSITNCATPCTYTSGFTPANMPYVITLGVSANFTRLDNIHIVNASRCIDMEGPSSGVAGIYTSFDHLALGCLIRGIKAHLVDTTTSFHDVHLDMWWFRGTSDILGAVEGNKNPATEGNGVGIEADYWANPMLSDVEFVNLRTAILANDATVTSGFGPLSFSLGHSQGTNISFNEVCQAVVLGNATTHFTSFWNNVIAYADTSTSAVPGQCANQTGASAPANFMFALNSDNAILYIAGLDAGNVQGVGLVGGGAAGTVHGQLHVSGLVIQDYSAFQNSTPAFLTDSTGSTVEADNLDYAYSQAATPGNKCSGGCAQKKPYNDIAAHLPTCSVATPGATIFVTDLLVAPVYQSTITTGSGGGAFKAPVYCDTTNWRLL